MQRVGLVDSREGRGELLAHVIEDRVVDVRVEHWPSLDATEGRRVKSTALVLNDLTPGFRGEFPPTVAALLANVAFDGPGLVLICSAHALSPVFQQGVAELKGPRKVITIEKANLAWVKRVVDLLNEFLLELRSVSEWSSLFPSRGFHTRLSEDSRREPSTELVLLKRDLKQLEKKRGLAEQLPIRREFIVQREKYLNGENGYSLS